MIEEKWVPENLEQLEKYAKHLEAMTAGGVLKLDAFTCSMIGFSFSRAVMEMRAARADGFVPRGEASAADGKRRVTP